MPKSKVGVLDVKKLCQSLLLSWRYLLRIKLQAKFISMTIYKDLLKSQTFEISGDGNRDL